LLWSPGFYSRKSVIGDRNVIITATQQKMNTIKNRFYIPNNSALILSGDITPERGFALAQRIFGDWPRGPDPFVTPAPNPPPLQQNRAVIVEKPVQAVTMYMAWDGPSVKTDPRATYAADVLSTVIGNPTSKYYKRLVDSGLTFGTSLSYYTLAHTGPIQAFAQLAPDKVLEAQRVILEEIRKFDDPGYITEDELAAAREQLRVQTLYQREQSSEFAHTVGFWWAVAGLDYYRTYLANMQKVTRADIASFARTYLIGKPFVTGVLISPEARKQLGLTPERLLQNGGVQ
jgi:zinc protease